MADVGMGGASPVRLVAAAPLTVVASRDGKQRPAATNPGLLAQVATASHPAGGRRHAAVPPGGAGPGGLGGGAQADFDSLIDLITSTIKPTSWDEVGGPGSIRPFETNLSLVVSQTQEVHEEIVDLLEQLRRLQDLQVTIEVRFITLNDNFFEQIGVDFDFDIKSNVIGQTVFGGRSVPNDGSINTSDFSSTAAIGIPNSTRTGGNTNATIVAGRPRPAQRFTADLDVPFTQGSSGLAAPQFGGLTPTAGATLGFAILSDIEAYFFINAAQATHAATCCRPPRSRCSTANRPSFRTRPKAPS